MKFIITVVICFFLTGCSADFLQRTMDIYSMIDKEEKEKVVEPDPDPEEVEPEPETDPHGNTYPKPTIAKIPVPVGGVNMKLLCRGGHGRLIYEADRKRHMKIGEKYRVVFPGISLITTVKDRVAGDGIHHVGSDFGNGWTLKNSEARNTVAIVLPVVYSGVPTNGYIRRL